MSSKLEYVARCLSRGTHKKYETLIINEIYSHLNNGELAWNLKEGNFV